MTKRQIQKVALWVVWSSCALLVIGLLVGLLVWAIRNQAEDNAHARRQIDALVTEVHDISDNAAQDRRIATRERRTLQRKLDAALAGQDALLRILRANGIPLPTKFVTRLERQIVVRHPRAAHHVKRHRSHRASMPAGHGKSGRAPGHHKHPRHGHRHR